MWEVWANMHGPLDYPVDWKVVSHELPDIAGEKTVVKNDELLDTRKLGYEYPSLDPPGVFEGDGEPLDLTLRHTDDSLLHAAMPETAGAALGQELTLGPATDVDVYWWFRGLSLKPEPTRRYTFWMTPPGLRTPVLRFPTVGVFAEMPQQSEIRLSLPFVMPLEALTRIFEAAPSGADTGFQLWYATGDVASEAVPREASPAGYDGVKAVIRRSRALAR